MKILSRIDLIKNSRFEITDILLNQNTNLFFTDMGKEVVIDKNYKFIFSLNDLSMDIIDLSLNLSVDKIDSKRKLLECTEKLKKENFYISPYLDKITKTFKTKEFKSFSTLKIETELLSFIKKAEILNL